MRADDVRFLFDYDRWATERVLDAWERLDSEASTGPIGDRSLIAIMVHTLGAAERWRAAFAGGPSLEMRERRPDLPGPAQLRADWETEWQQRGRWLTKLDDAAAQGPFHDPEPEGPDDPIEGAPLWQLMVHVVNHGTQHRSEAAALLTEAGASPGDLDLVDFVVERRIQSRRER
jgi:uncharacterized damage-inducible protein DinB